MSMRTYNNPNKRMNMFFQHTQPPTPYIQIQQQSLSSVISNPATHATTVSEDSSKKIRWGAPTWFAMHTLAEKLKDEYFTQKKDELLNIFYKICINLPCPDCANHATQYMQNVNFNAITTKEQLKNMLWHFHNNVNIRKNYPIFSREELDEKYSKAKTLNIIQHFFYFYEQKYINGTRLDTNKIARELHIKVIKQWIIDNMKYFNQ